MPALPKQGSAWQPSTLGYRWHLDTDAPTLTGPTGGVAYAVSIEFRENIEGRRSGGTLRPAAYLLSPFTPPAPTITQGGTAGAVSYTYAVAVVAAGTNGGGGTISGDSIMSATTNTTTGNATLTGTNYNIITVTFAQPVYGLVLRVIRTASAGTPASTGSIGTFTVNGTSGSFNDTGIAATAYTANTSQPVYTPPAFRDNPWGEWEQRMNIDSF